MNERWQASKPAYSSGGVIHIARFVKPAGDLQVIEAGLGDDACGVSQEFQGRAQRAFGLDPTICAGGGEQLRVYGFGELCFLVYGSQVTAGQWLKPGLGGTGIPALTNGDVSSARALQSGLAGQIGKVQVGYRAIGARGTGGHWELQPANWNSASFFWNF